MIRWIKSLFARRDINDMLQRSAQLREEFQMLEAEIRQHMKKHTFVSESFFDTATAARWVSFNDTFLFCRIPSKEFLFITRIAPGGHFGPFSSTYDQWIIVSKGTVSVNGQPLPHNTPVLFAGKAPRIISSATGGEYFTGFFPRGRSIDFDHLPNNYTVINLRTA